MEFGIELFTNRAIFVSDYHEISLAISVNDRLIEESLSKDKFNFHGLILGGKRLAGTGRKIVYSHQDIMEIFEARPAQPFTLLYLDPSDEIRLEIDTNLFLDPGIMVQDLTMKISLGNRSLEIPLNRYDVRINWPKRGFFVVDLSEYVKTMYFNRTCVF
ncbi:MAG: hypothetical protein PWP45_595 [Tepidanaerobacteraceae bacterium]|nr:hypothetical protein [Tepidanaerobacteraceae bacterium]